MTTVAVLDTTLRLNSAAFRVGMKQAAATANKTLGGIQAEAAKTAGSFDLMRKAAAGFVGFQFAKKAASSLVRAQVEMQQIHYTLLAATGSATQAGDAFSYVSQEAKKIGLDLQPAAQGFARLSASATALNVPMAQQKALFDAFAKSSATLHLSSENSTRALLALEQMFAKGKIQAQELRLQLGQAIPGAAARFQQAVLEMTKGTDLQGKSFDQLLQSGDLYTAKFLPALVQALQESSRGWEDASGSLNAQLNRLSSNWFKLKSEVSGGLFNDAATSGIKFLANNLEHLVDVAGLAGGVLAGRLAGKGLQSGFGAVAGIRATTKATLEEAAATATNTAAQVANSEQRVVAAAIRNRELQAKKVLAGEQLANAATQREVNLATANYTRIATQAARANAVYRASVVGLTEAQGINIVAQEANAAAVATSGFARAAKGAGGALLGLVGGPLGAAAIAIGGIAYAGYKLHKQWEDNREAATKQVQSISDVTESLRQLSSAYKDVNSRPTANALSEAIGGASGAIKKARDELARLQKEREHYNLFIAPTLSAFHLDGLNQDNFGKLDTDIAAVQARLRELQDQSAKTAGTLIQVLTPALKQELGQSIDDLVGKLSGAKSAFDVFRIATSTSILDAFKNAKTAATDASAKYADFTKNMNGAADAAKRGADEFGKTKSQVSELDLAAYKASPGFKLLAKDQQDAAVASAKAAIESQRHLEAMEAAKKGASSAESSLNKLQNGYESLAKSLRDNIANSDSMLDGSDKLTAAQKLQRDVAYALTHDLKKLDGTRKDMLQTLAAKAVAEEADAKAMRDKQALAERAQTTQRQLADLAAQQATEIARQNEGIGHGSKWNEQQRQLEAIADQYRKMRTEADKAYQADLRNHVDSAVAADAHAAALGKIVIGEQAATAAATQGFAQRDAAQADWVNGAKRAMEDYRDRAKDTAGQVADVFTNAANGMADAFAQFALTGKLSFKDMARSIVADIARIAAKKAIAGIFETALTGRATTSTYNSMGGVSHIEFAAKGGVYNSPSLSAYSGQIVNRPTPFKFASGAGLMGEAGPEAIMPLKRGPGGKLGVQLNGAGAGGVTVIIENHTDVQPKVSQSTGANGESIVKVLMRQVDNRMQQNAANPSSGFGRSLQSTYGLTRRGVPA